MDSVPQCQKRVQPFLFNPLEPKNRKVKLSWSYLKSDSPSNMENVSNTKSSWSDLKSDLSYNIKNSSNIKHPDLISSQIHHTISEILLQTINQIIQLGIN